MLITTKDRKTEKSPKFKTNLWFCVNYIFNTKEQTVIGAIINAFQGKNIQSQHFAVGYRIDLYFHDYGFAIEIEISTMKYKDKRLYKNIWAVSSLELIMIKKSLIFLKA